MFTCLLCHLSCNNVANIANLCVYMLTCSLNHKALQMTHPNAQKLDAKPQIRNKAFCIVSATYAQQRDSS